MKILNYILYGVLLSAIIALSITIFKERRSFQEQLVLNEKVIEDGRYSETYQKKEFDDLKLENKELYDSLKNYKKQIDYLVQFKYHKEYSTGVVSTSSKVENDTTLTNIIEEAETASIQAYEYNNEPNDSLEYKLTIGSSVEPNWYSLDVKVSDRFTLVNKESNGLNKIDITSDNLGCVDDVTIFKSKDKKSFWDYVAVGPSIGVGYDVNNNKGGFFIGATITYDISHFFKKKK